MLASLEPIIQKDIGDCGIASLAMVVGQPYRDVSEAALRLCKRPHTNGLYVTDAVRIARSFNVTLRRQSISSDDATGLLVVKRGKGKKSEAHMAALFQGVVVNPTDGQLWDFDTYLAFGKWTVNAILERVE